MQEVIDAYNKVMHGNYRRRVELMSEADVFNYYKIHNLPKANRESVLDHMSRWGGFNGLVMKEGLGFTNSALINRLRSGRLPLPFPPPRRQSMPWYEVIESPGPHPCTVNGVIRNRRLNRRTWNELLLVVEDCPWEVVFATPRAGTLLDAQLRFQFPQDTDVNASDPIFESTQTVRATVGQRQVIEILLRYGQWTTEFELHATGPTSLASPIEWPLQAAQWGLRSLAATAPS